jgi:ER membrane protein complex subunit 8/9
MVIAGCKIDQSAVLKIVLHAAKYPTSAVNGVMLGSALDDIAGSPPSSPQTGSGPTVQIVDVVPISHNYVNLALHLENALPQIEEYLRDQQNGMKIVGYYQCNENIVDLDLSHSSRRVGDKLEALYQQSVVVVLDNPLLGKSFNGSNVPSLQLFHKYGGKGWTRMPPTNLGGNFVCPMTGIADLLTMYFNESRHEHLIDYEDHMEDIKKDWFNKGLLD